MNLRILKKLSKKAVPYLIELGESREHFIAPKYECSLDLLIWDRKNWERMRIRRDSSISQYDIVKPAKDKHGGYICMSPPSYPLKGTPMVGCTSGYYEPEWDEHTAWGALVDWVRNLHSDVVDGRWVCLRKLDTPTEIFAAARELIEKKNTTN